MNSGSHNPDFCPELRQHCSQLAGLGEEEKHCVVTMLAANNINKLQLYYSPYCRRKMPPLKPCADKKHLWCKLGLTRATHAGLWPDADRATRPHMLWTMPDLPSLALPQVSLLQEEREAQGHPSLNLCGLPELHKAHQLASLIINHTAVSALTSQFTAGHTPCHCRMPILMNKRSS